MRWNQPIILVMVVILAGVMPASVASAQSNTGPLLITEVLPGSSLNAKDEFIEIYNNSASAIDFRPGNWAVQIASATATNWQNPLRTISLTGYLYPGYSYILGVNYSQTINGSAQLQTYPAEADQYFAPALSATAGHIRIVSYPLSAESAVTDQPVVSDEISWGSNVTPIIDDYSPYQLSASLSAGTSLSRQTTADGEWINTGVAMADFSLQATPTPQTTTADQPDWPISLITDPVVPTEPVVDNSTDVVASSQLPPQITELLPNPASPATDAADEFIELYNPNLEPINLLGYRLQAGLSVKHDYTFQDEVLIPAESYLAIYSQITKLSLSNTSGQARLFDPTGQLVSETPLYVAAKDGLVWQLYDGNWQWSSQPTPAAANQYSLPVVALKTITPKSTAIAKAAGPKVVTPKVAAPKKTTTTSQTKAAPKKTTTTAVAAMTAATQPTMIHSAVLAAVVSLALLYGAYEYRHDLVNRFHQLRGYRGLWHRARPAAAGRRSH